MRLSARRVTALSLFVGLAPLALLAYFSVTLAGDALRRDVESKVASTAAVSAQLVREELAGLESLVESYAARPTLVRALATDEERYDVRALRFHLEELRDARPGIFTAFIATPDGTLVDIVPPTPSIVGDDYSFRDWFKGVTATGVTYVSEAYQTQARGSALVVGVATHVRSEGREPLAILVAAYSLEHLQAVSTRLEAVQGVRLNVTDQRGVLVASGGTALSRLVSRRDDPRVAAALRGEAGVVELDTPDGRRLSAHAPVPVVGWTVTASVPTRSAFGAIANLRRTVAATGAVVALFLVAGVALLSRALRARERAEADARRVASINRAVLDATVDGIRLVDREGNTILTNAAMERMSADLLQLPAEGTIWERTLAVGERTTDPEGYRASMAEIAADPELEAVHEYQFADSGRWVKRYATPVRDSSGELIGRMFVLRELTKEREAERLKSELVATVSHELRTPLASILGFAELLVTRELDDATRRQYLDTIYGEATRLTTLINDFLDLQRIEEGAFRLSLEPFDVCQLVREQAVVFSGHSRAHSVDAEVPEHPLLVLGERDRIAQVVGNLVSNAIKYSPAGGRVAIAVDRRGHMARLSVTDEGLGIPVAQQQHLFGRFFRVDSSERRAIGGTGLGLALVREIVHAHGGRVGFESVEGEGSTFWVELVAAERGSGNGRGRVLVIEDDASAAALLSEYLAADGYAVEVATTGEEGLARVVGSAPDLVCLDIVLAGDVDGWDVLARLKDDPATAKIPVVVCTGKNGRQRAAALGAADYLAKPFSPERLHEALARLVRARPATVLVVDDDPTVRALVGETLRDEFHVQEAADGDEALASVAKRKPDAIVLDLLMPGLDGFAVLERLREDAETRAIPTIVLTAHRLSGEERDALHARAEALLEKSAYSAVELRRLVKQALGSPLSG